MKITLFHPTLKDGLKHVRRRRIFYGWYTDKIDLLYQPNSQNENRPPFSICCISVSSLATQRDEILKNTRALDEGLLSLKRKAFESLKKAEWIPENAVLLLPTQHQILGIPFLGGAEKKLGRGELYRWPWWTTWITHRAIDQSLKKSENMTIR